MESAGPAGAPIIVSSSGVPLDDLAAATVDDLTKAPAAAGRSGDDRESATDGSQPDPLGGLERDRASFSLTRVLLAMILASVVAAAIRRVVARRRDPDETLDDEPLVPANRSATDPQPGTADLALAAGRTGLASHPNQTPPLRVARNRPAEGTRTRPVRPVATRQDAPGQRRRGVGGPPVVVDGSTRATPRPRPGSPVRIEDHATSDLSATNGKRQPLDRRWLTRLPVKGSGPKARRGR
jgi:hypothetical protein